MAGAGGAGRRVEMGCREHKRCCLIADIWSVRSVALLALCVYKVLFKFYHTYLVCGFYLSLCAKLEDPLRRAQLTASNYTNGAAFTILFASSSLLLLLLLLVLFVGVVCGVRA